MKKGLAISFIFILVILGMDTSSAGIPQQTYLSDEIDPGAIYFEVLNFEVDPSKGHGTFAPEYLENVKNRSIIKLEILKSTDGIDLRDDFNHSEYFNITSDGLPVIQGKADYPAISAVFTTSSSWTATNAGFIYPATYVYSDGTNGTYVDNMADDIDLLGTGSISETEDTYKIDVGMLGFSVEIFKGTFITKHIKFTTGAFNIEFANIDPPVDETSDDTMNHTAWLLPSFMTIYVIFRKKPRSL